MFPNMTVPAFELKMHLCASDSSTKADRIMTAHPMKKGKREAFFDLRKYIQSPTGSAAEITRARPIKRIDKTGTVPAIMSSQPPLSFRKPLYISRGQICFAVKYCYTPHMPFCFILLYFLPFVKEAAHFVRKEHFSCYTKQGATGKTPRFRKSGAAGLRVPTLQGALLITDAQIRT
jgi:hypothetical protein